MAGPRRVADKNIFNQGERIINSILDDELKKARDRMDGAANVALDVFFQNCYHGSRRIRELILAYGDQSANDTYARSKYGEVGNWSFQDMINAAEAQLIAIQTETNEGIFGGAGLEGATEAGFGLLVNAGPFFATATPAEYAALGVLIDALFDSVTLPEV